MMTSLTKDQAGSIFDKVVETCEKELYDPKLKGVDWRRIAEIRKERILTAADEAEFEREFLSEHPKPASHDHLKAGQA